MLGACNVQMYKGTPAMGGCNVEMYLRPFIIGAILIIFLLCSYYEDNNNVISIAPMMHGRILIRI